MDFAKLVEVMDAHGVTFVSVIPAARPAQRHRTTQSGQLGRRVERARQVVGKQAQDRWAHRDPPPGSMVPSDKIGRAHV